MMADLPTVEGRALADLGAQLAAMRAENARLRGIEPEVPPRPPHGEGMPRYGIRWNGPESPLAVPMPDGYWTPWHLADAAIRDAIARLCVDQDRRGAFDILVQALGVCETCGGTGIAYDRRREDDAPLICCGGPRG